MQFPVLVDTSVWIDLFSKKPIFSVSAEQLANLAVCSPVIQEVLQGVKDDNALRKLKTSFLAMPRLGDPVDLNLYLEASDIYRFARSKGYTIRSAIDCLIAAIAIRYDVPVWHHDRDYLAISKITKLKVTSAHKL